MTVGLPDKGALLRQVRGRRDHWDRSFRPAGLETAGPGQESVWDYPRPPVVVSASGTPSARIGGHVVASGDRAVEVKETAGAPVPYFPPDDVRTDWLIPNASLSVCEWKGAAQGYDLVVPGGPSVPDAAWTYLDPFDDLAQGYAQIAGWFAFYPAKLECYVDQERVRPQPGGFYGGWVTDRIRGPIKGVLGSAGW